MIIERLFMNKNQIKLFTLISSGVGTIIGSGWLFGSAHAAALAGPASIISWVIGAIIILIISLSLIELSTISPIRMGSIGYYLRYTHGSFASFIAEWTILIGYISTVPSEATASTQYLSNWDFAWTKTLFDTQTQSLSTNGLIVSSILCVFYFLINYYSLSFLAKSIKTITIFKMVVPIIVIFSFYLISHYSGGKNYDINTNNFTPYGISGIFTAITTAGIIYAFNGFQSPISFAAESENPRRNVPIAIIASILFCAAIYSLLQYSYITVMPMQLISKHGWSGLHFASPFANLAIALNLNLIAMLLYIDAFVSPAGAGIIYNSVTARIMYGMSDHMPKIIGMRSSSSGIPTGALIVILPLSFICLWLLPSWDKLAAVISVGYILGYASATVCAISFRRIAPNKLHDKAIRIPGMRIFAPLGFILVTYMLYWSRWPLNGQVIFVVLLGLPIYFYYAKKRNTLDINDILKAVWIIAYLLTVALFAYLGSKSFGGINVFPDIIDHIVLIFISLFFFTWGTRVSHKTTAYILEIENNINTL